MPRFRTALALAMGIALFATVSASAATSVVNENDLGVTWFRADTRGDGSLAFESTYGGVNSTAAAVLSTPAAADKVQLLTTELDGTDLADVTALGYSTYRVPESTGFLAGVPSINLRVDRDGNGSVDTYLIFEPYQDLGNGAVLTGVWQTWDAYRGGAAKWWGSHLSGVGCGQATPCTWSSIVALFPDAQILEDPFSSINSPSAPAGGLNGSFGVNLGSGNAGLIGAVDALSITAGSVQRTFDFQNLVTLEGKDACRDGGWEASSNPKFRNQGDCVSYFASDGKTHNGD